MSDTYQYKKIIDHKKNFLYYLCECGIDIFLYHNTLNFLKGYDKWEIAEIREVTIPLEYSNFSIDTLLEYDFKYRDRFIETYHDFNEILLKNDTIKFNLKHPSLNCELELNFESFNRYNIYLNMYYIQNGQVVDDLSLVIKISFFMFSLICDSLLCEFELNENTEYIYLKGAEKLISIRI